MTTEFQSKKRSKPESPEDAMTSWLISAALGLSLLLLFVSLDRVRDYRISSDDAQTKVQPAVYWAQGLPPSR